MTTSETTPLIVSGEELWLLQSVVRHECDNGDRWHFPPASRSLNDMVASALLLCEVYNEREVALQVSYGDCLLIDYLVPANAKDAQGNALGKTLLLKSFACRAKLCDSYPLPDALDGNPVGKAVILQRLGGRDADPDTDPNDDANAYTDA